MYLYYMRGRWTLFAERGPDLTREERAEGFIRSQVARHRLGRIVCEDFAYNIGTKCALAERWGLYEWLELICPAIQISLRNCQFVLRCPSGPGAFLFAPGTNEKGRPRNGSALLSCPHSPVSLPVIIRRRNRPETLTALIQ